MFMNNYARSNHHVIKKIYTLVKNTVLVSETTSEANQKSIKRMSPSKPAQPHLQTWPNTSRKHTIWLGKGGYGRNNKIEGKRKDWKKR